MHSLSLKTRIELTFCDIEYIAITSLFTDYNMYAHVYALKHCHYEGLLHANLVSFLLSIVLKSVILLIQRL